VFLGLAELLILKSENSRVCGSIDSDQLRLILAFQAHLVRADSLRKSVRPSSPFAPDVFQAHGLHLIPKT
jgi:hypothetical protein